MSSTALLLQGGTVVNADGARIMDVLCSDGKIVALGADVASAPARASATVIDVSGKLVIPGMMQRAIILPFSG